VQSNAHVFLGERVVHNIRSDLIQQTIIYTLIFLKSIFMIILYLKPFRSLKHLLINFDNRKRNNFEKTLTYYKDGTNSYSLAFKSFKRAK